MQNACNKYTKYSHNFILRFGYHANLRNKEHAKINAFATNHTKKDLEFWIFLPLSIEENKT